MLVAVAPGKYEDGVSGSDDDWRIAPGQPGNNRKMDNNPKVGIRSSSIVTHVLDVIRQPYSTDAHLVPYVLYGPDGRPVNSQPRINKGGLSFVQSLGYSLHVDTLFCDVDNPGHCPWTPELLAESRRYYENRIGTAALSYTRGGFRLIQPLTRPIPIAEAESVNAWWLFELEKIGFPVDWSCKDWTRCYRVPKATVKGKLLELDIFADHMRPIEPGWSSESRKVGGQQRKVDFNEPSTGPVDGSPLAQAFQIAGWLRGSLGKGKRMVLCPWKHLHGPADVPSSTIIFAPTASFPIGFWLCSHAHCKGRSQRDMIRALPAAARRVLPKEKEPEKPKPPDPTTRDEARAQMENAFRRAPGGLSVLAVSCGAGKSRGAIQVAVERALRGRLYGKTAISVPTNELAIEITERVRSLGAAAKRIFGPPSLKDPVTKEPVCKLHASASILAGGISVPFEYCQGRGQKRCDHYDGCAARDGQDGPNDARIVVGPHSMLSMLSAEAGERGLLVIDEPGALTQTTVITETDLQDVFSNLSYFEPRFAAAMRVCVRSLQEWVKTGKLNMAFTIETATRVVDEDLLNQASNITGGAQNAVECAELAYGPVDPGRRQRPQKPPVVRSWVEISKYRPKLAATLAKTSEITELIHLGLTEREQVHEKTKNILKSAAVMGRIETRGRQQVLVLASWDVQLRQALTTSDDLGLGPRIGSIVIADAGGKYLLPALQNLQNTIFSTRDDEGHVTVPYNIPIPFTEIFVGDGAPVERTLLRTKASKTAWFVDDEFKVTATFVRSLKTAVNWVLDRGAQKTALITFKKAREELEKILANKTKPSKTDKEAVLRWEIGRELSRLPRPPDFGHYGAIRGLDHWKDHDCLITLGDPRPNLSDGRWDARFLGIDNWEARYAQLAASELEQAHGRLRTVHRTTPAFALHVGLMTPSGGHTWTELEDRGGTARKIWLTPEAVKMAVQLSGSIRAAARALGVSEGALRKILKGRYDT